MDSLPENFSLLNYSGDCYLIIFVFHCLVELHEGDVQMLVEEL